MKKFLKKHRIAVTLATISFFIPFLIYIASYYSTGPASAYTVDFLLNPIFIVLSMLVGAALHAMDVTEFPDLLWVIAFAIFNAIYYFLIGTIGDSYANYKVKKKEPSLLWIGVGLSLTALVCINGAVYFLLVLFFSYFMW